MMRNPVGLVWIPFLRSPSASSPVPHVVFSVTPAAITILRVMQWMAVVVCCTSLAVAFTWWNDSVVMEETATHLDGVVQRLNQANTSRSESMTRDRLTLYYSSIGSPRSGRSHGPVCWQIWRPPFPHIWPFVPFNYTFRIRRWRFTDRRLRCKTSMRS